MEWQQCSVGCGRFCDLAYAHHPEPWCCKDCGLAAGARHSPECAGAPYAPGHILYESDSDGDVTENESTEAGDSTGDTSQADTDSRLEPEPLLACTNCGLVCGKINYCFRCGGVFCSRCEFHETCPCRRADSSQCAARPCLPQWGGGLSTTPSTYGQTGRP